MLMLSLLRELVPEEDEPEEDQRLARAPLGIARRRPGPDGLARRSAGRWRALCPGCRSPRPGQ